MKPLLPNARNKCAAATRITRSISARPGARPRRRHRPGRRVRQFNSVQQRRHRLADRGPVRRLVVAGPDQGGTQRAQGGLVAQFGQPGTAQQRAQRRVAERGPVELAKMGVAAAVFEQQGVAHFIQRRAVLPGGQGAKGRPGDVSKIHPKSFRQVFPASPSGWSPKCAANPVHPRRGGRPSPTGLQAFENLYE